MKRSNLSFTLILYVLSFTSFYGCQSKQLFTDNRIMMGTTIVVASPYKNAGAIVFKEIQRIEGLLSKYKPESEVSKLNKSGKLKVSPETFYIIKKAKEFYRLSDGAFDITIAPLMDLWGFTNKNYTLPTDAEIKKNLNLVGSDKILLLEGDNVVEFITLGTKIDLGAIAKGYAIDCAVKKLKEGGIESCLINAGGQVYCLGKKFGKPWRVAIRNPRGTDFSGYLELNDKSVATSGDYEQYFIKDKKSFAHIINPKTGYPADAKISSVTVVAADGLTADALSTAIFVLGKEKGEQLLKRFPGAEVKIIEN